MDERANRKMGRAPSAETIRCEPVITLLDLVNALHGSGASDSEAVAAVVDLVATGRVQLASPVDGETW